MFLDAGAVCAHLVPVGSVYEFLAEHRHRLFPDVSDRPQRILDAVREVIPESGTPVTPKPHPTCSLTNLPGPKWR